MSNAPAPARRGGWIRILGIVLAVILAVAVVGGGVFYKAFEPDLTARSGWAPLPEGPYPVTSVAPEDWAEAGERARAWLEAARAEAEAPALSAAVSVDGRIVWVGVAGFADLDQRIEATPTTAFRIGSSSKAVTSIAMGTLIAADAVDLDAPVSTYMPDLAPPLATVTTRQAMGHQAGVREYGPCLCFPISEYYSRTHYETQRDALRPFERSPLLFTPGAGFSYSSYGYNVAGGVIEAVTGERFADFMEEAVFAPLGLAASRADSGRPAEGEARFYTTGGPGYFKETFRVDYTNRLPSGGILSTPSDMVRLGAEMIDPTLFDDATRDLLMRPQTLADGSPNPQGYGLGWRYARETALGPLTVARLTHNGTALGSTSYFTIFPQQRMVVSVMVNTSDAPGRRSIFEHAEELSAMFAAEVERRTGGAASP